MATFIITGNYTGQAIQGMIANPSDRAAAVKPLVEAAGGKMLSYYATTGETDFLMICEAADGEDINPRAYGRWRVWYCVEFENSSGVLQRGFHGRAKESGRDSCQVQTGWLRRLGKFGKTNARASSGRF